MSKLIVEMEMPSSCFGCPMSINYNKIIICSLDNARRKGDFDFRPDWCPITGELPDKHGDLIDRDALLLECTEWFDHSKSVDEEDILNAKAVIAAERSET